MLNIGYETSWNMIIYDLNMNICSWNKNISGRNMNI